MRIAVDSASPFVPRPSLWLLAAALFFAAVPSLRAFGNISFCDIFVVLAVAAGFFEKLASGATWLSPHAIRVLVLYGMAAALFWSSFLANSMFETPSFGPGVAIKHIGSTSLTDNASILFGVERAQEGFFFVLFFNLIMLPLLMMLVDIRGVRDVRFLLVAWLCGTTIGAIYTVAYCRGWISGPYDWGWDKLRRARGLTPHPNMLSYFSVLAVPIAVMFLQSSRRWSMRLGLILVLWFLWQAVNYSGSRSAVAGYFMVIALYWIWNSPSLRGRALRLASLGIFAGFAVLLQQVLVPWLRSLGEPGSGVSRLLRGGRSSDVARDLMNDLAWQQAWSEPLFGVGYQVLRVAHNSYLQVFHAGGLIGICAYTLTLAYPVFLLLRRPSASSLRDVDAVFGAILTTIILLSAVKSNPAEFTIALLISTSLIWLASMQTGDVFSPLLRRQPENAATAVPPTKLARGVHDPER